MQPRTIKPETEKRYQIAVRSLVRQSIQARSPDPEQPAGVTLQQVVQDLIDRREALSEATFRTYRAALQWHCLTRLPNEPWIQDALDLIQSAKPRRGRPPRSNDKPLAVTREEYLQLHDALTEMGLRSPGALRSLYWVMATYAYGLRPVEWLDAEWAPDGQILRVRNAKVKAAAPAFLDGGKAPEQGQYREVANALPRSMQPTYNDFTREHMAILRSVAPAHLPDAERRQAFTKYHRLANTYIYRACQRAWGSDKLVSLYTFRSQWFANAKAAFGPQVAAKMMGHSGVDTPSASHYAKRNQAHPGIGRKGGQRPSMQQAERDFETEAAGESWGGLD